MQIELNEAQAVVVRYALDVAVNYMRGSLDGCRHTPWEAYAMDADEGDEVPGALTHEAGFMLLISETRREIVQGLEMGA